MSNEEVFEKPTDRLSLKVNGEMKEVFMSSGLRDRLVAIASSLDDITVVFIDAKARQQIIIEALRPRNERGKPTVEFTEDDFEISTEDSDRLVVWIAEHVTHFFVSGLNSAKSLSTKSSPIIEKLMKSTPISRGSEVSQEQKQPVGGSTVSPVI